MPRAAAGRAASQRSRSSGGRFWAELATRYQLTQTTTAALHQLGACYHTCFNAFPDAIPCLSALRAGGLQLAVLTNFELPSINLTLQHVGIEPGWFAALLSSAAIGCRKPDACAFRTTADALGLPLEACAFVDDLAENVEAALALWMPAWRLDRYDDAPSGVCAICMSWRRACSKTARPRRAGCLIAQE